jgi:hypothetical protein
MKNIHVCCLTGKVIKLEVDDTTTIATLFEKVRVANEFPNYMAFSLTYLGKSLESYGLWKTVSELPYEEANLNIRIYMLLNLGAYGPALGRIRNQYRSIVCEMIAILLEEPNADVSKLEAQRINADSTFSALRDLKARVRDSEPVNDEDPITLDKLDPKAYNATWLENGKCFSMSWDSLKQHVKKNMYVDEFGLPQVKNPLTNIPIQEPWRTEFIYEARREYV